MPHVIRCVLQYCSDWPQPNSFIYFCWPVGSDLVLKNVDTFWLTLMSSDTTKLRRMVCDAYLCTAQRSTSKDLGRPSQPASPNTPTLRVLSTGFPDTRSTAADVIRCVLRWASHLSRPRSQINFLWPAGSDLDHLDFRRVALRVATLEADVTVLLCICIVMRHVVRCARQRSSCC